jgi:integrase/recombinase XerD
MKPLRDAIEEYLALRRSLGFKLRQTAAGLTEFAAFMEQKAAPYLTTALALEWAMQPVDNQPSGWAQRLGFVRVFARHWSASDPRTEIPPAGLLPFRARRARPYLYSEQEIQRLLSESSKLMSHPSKPKVFREHTRLAEALGGRKVLEVINKVADLVVQEGILVIGADNAFSIPPEVFHGIEVGAAFGQPQQLDTQGVGQTQGTLGRVRGVFI